MKLEENFQTALVQSSLLQWVLGPRLEMAFWHRAHCIVPGPAQLYCWTHRKWGQFSSSRKKVLSLYSLNGWVNEWVIVALSCLVTTLQISLVGYWWCSSKVISCLLKAGYIPSGLQPEISWNDDLGFCFPLRSDSSALMELVMYWLQWLFI